MAITKTLDIKIGDQSFEVPVSFRVIEIAETVFDCTADQVIGYHLIDASRIKRTLVARVITNWIEPPKGFSRQDLYEKVMVCSATQLTKYAGAIQGAIAFALSYVDDDQLQMLANGQDLPPATDDTAAGGKKARKK